MRGRPGAGHTCSPLQIIWVQEQVAARLGAHLQGAEWAARNESQQGYQLQLCGCGSWRLVSTLRISAGDNHQALFLPTQPRSLL